MCEKGPVGRIFTISSERLVEVLELGIANLCISLATARAHITFLEGRRCEMEKEIEKLRGEKDGI